MSLWNNAGDLSMADDDIHGDSGRPWRTPKDPSGGDAGFVDDDVAHRVDLPAFDDITATLELGKGSQVVRFPRPRRRRRQTLALECAGRGLGRAFRTTPALRHRALRRLTIWHTSVILVSDVVTTITKRLHLRGAGCPEPREFASRQSYDI